MHTLAGSQILAMSHLNTHVTDLGQTLVTSALVGGLSFFAGDLVAQALEQHCEGLEKQDVRGRRPGFFNGDRTWSFTLTGILSGFGVSFWFEMLMTVLPPTSARNNLLLTILDNVQNLGTCAAVLIGNACIAHVPIWPILRADFPPFLLLTLCLHVPLDLFLFFFVKVVSISSVISVLVDGMTTIVLSYFTFRNIESCKAAPVCVIKPETPRDAGVPPDADHLPEGAPAQNMQGTEVPQVT